MKIAFVHDWLVSFSGSERVLEQMILCYPDADIYSLIDFIPADERSFILNKKVHTSFIQKLPGVRTHYRKYLALMPLAIEQFDLSSYDLIISSSHAVAKGILVGPNQLHICMCYSPIRYAWDLQHQYLMESDLNYGVKSIIARFMLHKIRIWDTRTSFSVDSFIAISAYISRRIEKIYRRESRVIYPPVNTSDFSLNCQKSDFYFTVSRMVPYKKIPLIVEAFSSLPDKKLIVIGDGPDLRKCHSLAGPNVKLLGYQPLSVMKEYMQQARAFVFAAEEDFGIAPLEAQACGTPVIAFGKGAAIETIVGLNSELPTGVFFDKQSVESIIDAVKYFEQEEYRILPSACRDNALRFSPDRFRSEFVDFVEEEIKRFQKKIS